jgi:phosphohistidine swiveling domain-containing protein
MGLPAVVGVENATAVIPDGAMVHLDGLKGEIIIEDSVILQAESVHSLQ